MNEEELKEIRERCEKASQNKWEQCSYRPGFVKAQYNKQEDVDICDLNVNELLGFDQTEYNASFIAHSRQDIPKLLYEVQRLKEDLELVRDPNSCKYPYDSCKFSKVHNEETEKDNQRALDYLFRWKKSKEENVNLREEIEHLRELHIEASTLATERQKELHKLDQKIAMLRKALHGARKVGKKNE